MNIKRQANQGKPPALCTIDLSTDVSTRFVSRVVLRVAPYRNKISALVRAPLHAKFCRVGLSALVLGLGWLNGSALPSVASLEVASLEVASLEVVSLEVVSLNPLLNAFDPPPDQDAPRSTAGGGSRPSVSACGWTPAAVSSTVSSAVSGVTEQAATSSVKDQSGPVMAEGPSDDWPPPAIALAPETFVGQSQSARPTLWLHNPSADIASVEISVFDHQLNGLAQNIQTLPAVAGLVPVQLSKDIALAPGESYYWSAAFICNPERRTEDWVVGGWIKYEPLPATAQPSIKAEPSLAQVNQHLTTGYWYDALNTLLLLIDMESPSDETQVAWLELLQQANINPGHIDLGHTDFSHTDPSHIDIEE